MRGLTGGVEGAALFSNQDLGRLLVPLLVEQVLNFSLGFADIAMVSSLGEAAVSGVSLVDTITVLVTDLFAALATGGAVVVAHYIGGRDFRGASEAAKQLLFVILAAGVLFMTALFLFFDGILEHAFGNISDDVALSARKYFGYMLLSFPLIALYNAASALFRAQGNSMVAMNTSILINVINIGGNALCIFVLHMGVEGVAIPTLVSRGIAAAVLLALLHRKPRGTGVDVLDIKGLHKLRADLKVIKHILAIGVPGGIENSLFQLGKLLIFTIMAGFGTGAIAANAAAGSLSTFLCLPGKAVGLGLLTVVGQCLGARKPESAVFYTHRMMLWGYGGILLINVPMLIFGGHIINIFALNVETAALAQNMFNFHIYAILIWPLSFVLPNALRAANDARFTMWVSLLSMATVRIGFSYLFAGYTTWGAMGVWYAMVLDWTVRGIFFIIRFERRTWMRHYKIE